MKIHSLTFNDTARHWKLAPTKFNDRLTLLVGASGVGKTQILQSIMKLQRISKGKLLYVVEWKVEFLINGSNYLWEGKFDKGTYNITYERLIQDGVNVIKRDDKDIELNGHKTVKLSQQHSAIYLLKEEDAIKDVYADFQKIILNDFIDITNRISISSSDINIRVEHYITIKSIQESGLLTKTKLYLASKNVPEVFEQIKARFRDVFIFVEDIKVETFLSSRTHYYIEIKEQGVDEWIDERYISSGMLKTLMQISELYLSASGTVVLIDEFENSLGVNCINEVIGDLLSSRRDLQFIITSHHPYIINSIGYENWKLVTRKAGVVSTHDASEFNLGKSKHEAFTQLLNLDIYADGPQL